MEMIDVLKKLEEIAQTRPELVKDAVDNVSRTNPAQVQDNAVKTAEGGMSDIHIGAQEVVGEYADEDGNLKMPKADVLRAMAAEKAKAAFPLSYEIEIAMGMVQDKFDDAGQSQENSPAFPSYTDGQEESAVGEDTRTARRYTSDQIDSLKQWAKKYSQYKNLEDINLIEALYEYVFDLGIAQLTFEVGELQAAERKIGKKQEDWEDAEINAAMEMSPISNGLMDELHRIIPGDKVEIEKKLNTIKTMLQKAGLKEAGEEALEGKIPAGLKAYQDKKAGKKETVKESIQISTDTPQEASMMMQLLKLAGVQTVDQAMISQEPEHSSDMDPGALNKQMDVPGDDAIGSMQMAKMRDMMTAPAEEKAEETFANSMGDEKEEPKYQDTDTLVNFHSGGLNSQKQQVRKEYPGDNPLAVKEDTISEEDVANSLRAQYEGFKAQYQEAAKPDFLDMDKDGDRKESAVREDEETHPLWGDWGTTPQEWSDTHVANNDDMVMAIAKGQIPPKPVTLSSYFDEQNDLWPEGVEGGKYNDEQIIDIISDTVGYDCRALGYDYLVKIRDGEVKGMYKPTPEQIKTAQEIIKNPEFAKAKARNSRPMESTSEDAVREDSAKPDFLDMDKDGDKKEPMKKAIKDKEAK